MYSSRLATLAAICAVAAAIGAAGASGSGIKGEPVFQGSLGPQSTSPAGKPAMLDPAQIGLDSGRCSNGRAQRRPPGSRTPPSRLGAAGEPRAPHRQQPQLVRLDDRGDRRTPDRRHRRNRSMDAPTSAREIARSALGRKGAHLMQARRTSACSTRSSSPASDGTHPTGRGKIMGTKLLLLVIVTVLACVTAATGLAAGSTQVTHFSFTTPPHLLCGVEGTAVVHGTSVFRDTGNGTYFMSGNFVGVFTADNGRSTTLKAAGPQRQTSPAVIDEQAGTVTITTAYDGLFEQFSITGGPILGVDGRAGHLRRYLRVHRGSKQSGR